MSLTRFERIARRTVSVVVGAPLLAGLLVAPPAYAQSHRQATVSAGAGWSDDDGPKPAVAVSLERIGSGGISLGGEVSLIFFDPGAARSRGRKAERSVMFVASGLIGRRWNSAKPLTPFLNAGVAAIRDPDCCGTGLGGQVGGGIDYALSSRVAIRSAASVAVPFGGEGGIVTFRLGVAFR